MTTLMRKLKRRVDDDFDWMFYCPACRCEHSFRVRGLSPTYKLTMCSKTKRPSVTPELSFEWGDGRCRVTISDGMMCYAAESSHRFSGMTIPMEAMRT